MPELFRGELPTMGRYTNPASFTFTFYTVSFVWLTAEASAETHQNGTTNVGDDDVVDDDDDDDDEDGVETTRLDRETVVFSLLASSSYSSQSSFSSHSEPVTDWDDREIPLQ